MKKYYYDAFISYRHKELDSFVAEKIHKSLERYHVPKRVENISGKKKVERVFRDRDELPTSSDLADNIKVALENSEFLIVVCSPDVVESKWVQQEIELFLETHSRDHILAVLISGEPEESFPEALRIVKEEVVGEDGMKTVISRNVEPLAADIRAKSRSEIEKKLKTERLRLLAPILKCSYDDLRQRHREYVMQKAMIAGGVVCCLVLAFTGYTLYQSARVREQYLNGLEKESRYLTEVSANLLKSGDREGALEKALEALPKDEDDDRPLVPEAIYQLNNALYTYTYDERLEFKPGRLFEMDSEIQYECGFSTDETYYMEIDKLGIVYIFNCQNGELHWKVDSSELDGVEVQSFLNGGFITDEKAVIITKTQMVFLDLEKKKVTDTISFDGEVSENIPLFCVNEKYIAAGIDFDRLVIYETETDKIVYQKDFSEEELDLIDLKGWNEDGSTLAMEFKEKSDSYTTGESDLFLLNVETGEEEFIYKPGNEVCKVKFLDDNRIALLESRIMDSMEEYRVSQVRVYDRANKKDLWISEEYDTHTALYISNLFFENMKYEGAQRNVLGYYVNDLLVLADAETGEVIVKVYYSDMISGVGVYKDQRLLVGTRDGKIHLQTLEYSNIPYYAGKGSNQVATLQYNETYNITIQSLRDSNASIVSRVYADKAMELIELDNSIEHVIHKTLYGENQKVYRIFIFEEKNGFVVQDIEATGDLRTIDIDDKLIGDPKIYLYEKDGKCLLSYYANAEDYEVPDYLATLDLESGKELYRATGDENENLKHGDVIYSNQSDMATSYSGDEFSIFQVSDGKTLLPQRDYFGDVYISKMYFSADDRYLLAIVDEDDTIRIKRWNIEEARWEKDDLSKVELSERVEFRGIKIGQIQNIMAVYDEKQMRIFDIETGNLLKEFSFSGESECEYAFAGDDDYLLMYGDEKKVTLWNIEEEKAVMERKEDFAMFGGFQVDPDGKYFAAKENRGYTDLGPVAGGIKVFTLDLEQEQFFPYADISQGWICFETNEVGSVDMGGKVHVSPIRSLETLRAMALQALE